MKIPTVAVIGRPNVGKSTLFNRFLKKQVAVVDEQPGITRDRNYAVCEWGGVSFRLVDTGGIVPQTEDLMEKLIYDQTEFAVNESDLVLLILDTLAGVDPADRKIARLLHKSGKNCVLVANKADSERLEGDIFEFLTLGLGDPVPISARVGRGIGELLDKVVAALPVSERTTEVDESAIKVAVVGRPNVGKSSFINQLIGEPRLLVTPMAGTTRDAVDTTLELEEQKYILIDTAGLRRKYKVHENVEFYTTLRAVRAIGSCDVAVVLVDASTGLTTQDKRILEEVFANRRAAVLAVNKWDLVEKNSMTAMHFTKAIKANLAKYSYLPVIYVSALTGQRVAKVMSLVKNVYAETNKRIPTAQLNEFLQKVISRKHPPSERGKYIKFNYVAQSEVAPPTFVFFANHPQLIDKSYIRYLSNQIRQEFGFEGVPFRLKFRKK